MNTHGLLKSLCWLLVASTETRLSDLSVTSCVGSCPYVTVFEIGKALECVYYSCFIGRLARKEVIAMGTREESPGINPLEGKTLISLEAPSLRRGALNL